MECPYCHGVLVLGTLFGDTYFRAPIRWYPKGKRVVFPSKKRIDVAGGVQLRQPLPGAGLPAHRCATCGRIIIFDP